MPLLGAERTLALCKQTCAPSNSFNWQRKISIEAQRAIYALLAGDYSGTCVFSKYNYLLF